MKQFIKLFFFSALILLGACTHADVGKDGEKQTQELLADQKAPDGLGDQTGLYLLDVDIINPDLSHVGDQHQFYTHSQGKKTDQQRNLLFASSPPDYHDRNHVLHNWRKTVLKYSALQRDFQAEISIASGRL